MTWTAEYTRNESNAATLVVDETPPRINLSSPASLDILPYSFKIEGSIEDGTLSEYEIHYRKSDGDWILVKEGMGPGLEGVLADVYLSGARDYEGPGEIRIRAWDMAGNFTELSRAVHQRRDGEHHVVAGARGRPGGAGPQVVGHDAAAQRVEFRLRVRMTGEQEFAGGFHASSSISRRSAFRA